MPTYRAFIDAIAARFRRAGISYGHGTTNAEDEAAWLVVHTADQPFEALPDLLERPLPGDAMRRASRLAGQRIRKRVPLAYLLHEAWLGDYKFYVDDRVIVPRSYLAELLRRRLSPWVQASRVMRILDLCTGSGCLGIIAASTFPKAQVDAVDLSDAALAVAQKNVNDYGLSKRVRLLRSDLYSALNGEQYDLILTNPPYVLDRVMQQLPEEYRREPTLALAGGRSGLDLVNPILRQSRDHLRDKGWLFVETGHARSAVTKRHPDIPFIWPETSGGDDCVLAVQKEQLKPAPRPVQSAPNPSAKTRHVRSAAKPDRA